MLHQLGFLVLSSFEIFFQFFPVLHNPAYCNVSKQYFVTICTIMYLQHSLCLLGTVVGMAVVCDGCLWYSIIQHRYVGAVGAESINTPVSFSPPELTVLLLIVAFVNLSKLNHHLLYFAFSIKYLIFFSNIHNCHTLVSSHIRSFYHLQQAI